MPILPCEVAVGQYGWDVVATVMRDYTCESRVCFLSPLLSSQ
jgi:hypothetical protein